MKNWEKMKVNMERGVGMKRLDLKSNMCSLTELLIRHKPFFFLLLLSGACLPSSNG